MHRTLRKHTTICSSVLFRPRRPTSILSSGLDSVIVVWEDFSRCRVGQVVKMADVVKVAAANKREMEGDAEPEPPSSYMVQWPFLSNSLAIFVPIDRLPIYWRIFPFVILDNPAIGPLRSSFSKWQLVGRGC